MALVRRRIDRLPRPVDIWSAVRTGVVRHRRLLPAVGLIVAALVAYHYTLSTMFDYLVLDTPLAYLPLLPLFTVGLAAFTVNRYRGMPEPGRDRQLDLIVGIPLLLVAVALVTVVPALSSTYYWTDRGDVLSLAFFAAGGVIVLYGTTWFWRLRSALVFLLLMWPALYLHVLSGVMNSFTAWTNSTLSVIVTHVGALGVTPVAGDGNLSIEPLHGGAAQLINIGTACSGANSVLGFALIGGALLTVVRGGLLRKMGWLVCGLALCFALNVIRLISIMGLARLGHPGLALGGYHAIIGLVLFCIGTLIMLFLLSRFGLEVKPPVHHGPVARDDERRRWTAGRIAATAGLAAVVGLLFAADSQLAPYAAFVNGSGIARVAPFPGAQFSGFATDYVANYPWAKQYFGENSSFDRYMVTSAGHGVVYADVVRTSDRSTLDAYNLQNCFLFHDYDISTSRRIDMGNGVTGLLLNYSDPSTKARWATVSWAWPVLYHGQTYFERVALTSNLYGGSGRNDGPNLRPDDGLRGVFLDLVNTITGGGSQDRPTEAMFTKADGNLTAVGELLVAGTVHPRH